MAEEKVTFDETDELCVRNIGTFCADVVEKANSGHPGAPMGMAAIAHVLFSKVLNASSSNASFANRDRFILSNGHACSLQYTMLHLCGYNVKMSDLQSFRQLGSITPGHPENHQTEGVEISTGPLGQGIAQAVGLAIAGKYAQSQFGEELFNHKIYVFCGDGCMQEGVASEASSLAGHLQLDNLILIYDDNHIQIDGNTDLAFTESVSQRYQAYGWNVVFVDDGNKDLNAIHAAIKTARDDSKGKPTLIQIRTHIGYGSTKQDTHGVHGAPLGGDALKDYKKTMGFDTEQTFVIKDEVYKRYQDTFVARGKAVEAKWNELKQQFCQKQPEKGKLLDRLLSGKLPENWMDALPKFDENSKKDATRSINGAVLNAIAKVVPELIGGAADLTPSTKTQLKCSHDFQANSRDGRYLRFGVREFGMFAIGNGIAAYGLNLVPFTSTFLNFLTYGYGAVRLGALSHLRQIYIMTHDSVLLGEDGPTHQPVEVIPSVRALPNALLLRPADGNEINECWKIMLNRVDGPSVICLSRQTVNTNLVSKYTKVKSADGVKCGAYVLSEEEKDADVILLATGSEVELALEAAQILDSLNVRVVSAVCLELFEQQDMKYKQSVIKPNTLVISLEASSTYGWQRYAHKSFGIDEFGRSAPISAIRQHFGLTGKLFAENITQTVQKW
eukprot:CAMPEP_0197043732 /NCGR_PEP_ID=MMETSP1384-20130603/19927_1 /TAXON_ID=29189 /ORGANISM="Ammonia sp." /LENGTH=671 /DNA_ID=CAMNT_0042475077 /DNA_START=81 /DNA_END=2093 /DNA_ORIENTATION=+